MKEYWDKTTFPDCDVFYRDRTEYDLEMRSNADSYIITTASIHAKGSYEPGPGITIEISGMEMRGKTVVLAQVIHRAKLERDRKIQTLIELFKSGEWAKGERRYSWKGEVIG